MRYPGSLLALIASTVLAVGTARAQTSEIGAAVVDEEGKPVADAVIVAVPVDGNMRVPVRTAPDIVDQVDKQFVPKVKAVVVGSAITFPNHDNVRHHVYSFSPAKRFELPLYSGIPAQPVIFDRAGVVVLGCNIHDWMIGFIYVSPSPYVATTAKDGKATLSDLPARAYLVHVWHPQLDATEESTVQTIDITRGKSDLRWTVKLKPEVRVRRAPPPERGSRY